MRVLFLSALVAALTAVSSPAMASDSCGDVLAEGPFSKIAVHKNDYYMQLVYSRFAQMSWAEYQKSSNAGGTAWLDAIPFSGNLSQTQFEAKKKQIQESKLNLTTQQNELDYVAFTGDDTVVGAWRECMQDRGGGLKVRFAATPSATQAFLVIEFISATGTSTTLPEDINLPAGVTALSGGSCLKAGKVIKAGLPCIASLTLPSYDTSFSVAVNTDNGAAMAFLPKRVKVIYEKRPFEFTANCNVQMDWFTPTRRQSDLDRCEDRLPRWEHKTGWHDRVYTLDLPKTLLDQGWRFEPATAKSRMEELNGDSMTHCHHDLPVVADMFRFQYGYNVHAEVTGHSSSIVAVCKVEPAIDVSRIRVVPIDDAENAGPPATS